MKTTSRAAVCGLAPRAIRLHTAALLAAALACGIAVGPVGAASFTIGGDVSLAYSFNGGPPNGYDYFDSFSNANSTSSTADTAIYAFSDSVKSFSGQVDARATIGAVGLSGHTSYEYKLQRSTNGDGYQTMRGSAIATAIFTDVLVTGPGSGAVSTRLRLHLDGILNTTSNGTGETEGSVGSSYISLGISINGNMVNFGNLLRTSTDGGSPQVSPVGMFVGFVGNGVLITDFFTVSLNTPITVKLEM